MQLILFRHGIAMDREDPACPPDPERALTDRGLRRTRDAARGLRVLGPLPDAIFTSPYLRAAQTAEIVADVLGLPASAVATTDRLLPGASPSKTVTLAAKSGAETVLFAGHAPGLDLILTGLLDLPYGGIRLKKAGAACVAIEDDVRLRWFLEPRALRRLGEQD